MIELAPNWKRGLALAYPLMIAAGGYADYLNPNVGAIITLPTTMQARTRAPQLRVIEIPGGALINTGAINPGLAKAIRENDRAWAHSPIPIIVAFAVQAARDWSAMANQLERVAGVAGIELHLNPTMNAGEAIRATRAMTELPILAKLDLDNACTVAEQCVHAGANALVIGRAPRGMAIINGRGWHGRLYSPVVKSIALNVLNEIRDLKLEIPLIGCGGIHTAEDARDFLAAGASAFQVDSAMWIDPDLVFQNLSALNSQLIHNRAAYSRSESSLS